MKIGTRDWGTLEISDDQIINMPEGLLGFENSHRFILLNADDSRPFAWYLSVDDPDISFAVADPSCFHEAPYTVTLSETDEAMLDLEEGDTIAIFVIAAIGESGQVTGNLTGPIVLNTRNRLARQIITYGSSFTARQPILNQRVAPLLNPVEDKAAG